MKLLSLNLWGGRQGQMLIDYIKQQSSDVDVFCFQEVFNSKSEIYEYYKARPHLLEELSAVLPEYQVKFSNTYSGWVDMHSVDFDVWEGQAMFVKKPITIKQSGQVYIHGSDTTQIIEDFSNEPKDLQYAVLDLAGKEFLVCNVHGKWHPGEKLDTPERIEQSKIILEFLAKYNLPKIVCGDFNLMPQTESIKMLEGELRNLISEFNIKNTRNEISWMTYNNIQNFADYTFVSRELKVDFFEVPYNEVSDHLPMILGFKIWGFWRCQGLKTVLEFKNRYY